MRQMRVVSECLPDGLQIGSRKRLTRLYSARVCAEREPDGVSALVRRH